jgi:hypothetical protein
MRVKSYIANNLILKWFKKEPTTDKFIEINETTRQKINLKPDNFSLEILNIDFTDSGTYMCKIQTDYGEHYKNFDLIVYGNLFIFIVTHKAFKIIFFLF